MKEGTDSVDAEKIQAQIQAMDALLAQGRAAMAKVDAFYEDHGLTPGIGEKALLGDAVPDRHRTIFSKLLAELSKIDQRIDELDQNSPKPAPVAVSARAVGNRYRI